MIKWLNKSNNKNNQVTVSLRNVTVNCIKNLP